ncbi:MAG: hypothetical protein ABI456_25730, partial [Ktedonobacteraceae bacterium]
AACLRWRYCGRDADLSRRWPVFHLTCMDEANYIAFEELAYGDRKEERALAQLVRLGCVQAAGDWQARKY